jgi:hypothetical protein
MSTVRLGSVVHVVTTKARMGRGLRAFPPVTLDDAGEESPAGPC